MRLRDTTSWQPIGTDESSDAKQGFRQEGMKRYLILVACAAMLVCLGTNQGWSVFIPSLRAEHGFSALRMQWIFNASSIVFAFVVIVAGRLHDRFGPRPLAAASAVLIGAGWTLAWAFGKNYWCLWTGIAVLASSGCAIGYLCPIATAIKWFPNRKGLASGVTAACFACGPVLLSTIAESLLRRQWTPMEIFGFVALTYAPVVLLAGMMLARPAGQPAYEEVAKFRRSALPRDRRFWTLFVGMFTGTLPFLVVMGNAKPLALDFGLPASLAAVVIAVMAIANASGRIFWGAAVDRIGPRRAMLTAQALAVASLIVLLTAGRHWPAAFMLSVIGVGFCFGSNMAIHPAAVTGIYGAHVLGSVYPFIIGAMGVASIGTTANGFLKDVTGSNIPGLLLALFVAVAGGCACFVLSRSLISPKTSYGADAGSAR